MLASACLLTTPRQTVADASAPPPGMIVQPSAVTELASKKTTPGWKPGSILAYPPGEGIGRTPAAGMSADHHPGCGGGWGLRDILAVVPREDLYACAGDPHPRIAGLREYLDRVLRESCPGRRARADRRPRDQYLYGILRYARRMVACLGERLDQMLAEPGLGHAQETSS